MDHWLMDLPHLLLVDDWLVNLVNYRLVVLMNNVLMMLMNYFLVMLMNYVLVVLLYNRLSNVSLDSGCCGVRLNNGLTNMSLHDGLLLVLDDLGCVCEGFLNYWLSDVHLRRHCCL